MSILIMSIMQTLCSKICGKNCEADYCTLGYHSISALYQKYFSVFGSISFFIRSISSFFELADYIITTI